MNKKLWIYIGFFVILMGVYYLFVHEGFSNGGAKLAVINNAVPAFSFVNQDGKTITQKDTDDKVYVAEYFFTTCKGICPKMNANMRRVYEAYKNEKNFLILSHTCMPEVDSVHVLKAYENQMLNGKLIKRTDGTYKIEEGSGPIESTNWQFLTGDKAELYRMARLGYIIDNGKPDSTQQIENQFIHTQFFALVDKYRRVRGIYDGLKEDEIKKLLKDIQSLLDEKVESKRFMGGFTNNPS